jgi:uncharacterized paraquat-inducible protein A
MARVNAWIFVGIGLFVIAISIFMYDELRFFIVLGGIMTLYGLGKLAVNKAEKKWDKVEDTDPIRVDEKNNPYLQQHVQNQHRKQQRRVQHQAHKDHQQRAQHSQQRGKYCPSCGYHLAATHRFCGACGQQV